MALYRPALLHALSQGYSRHDFVADLFAGVLVGVVALPLSMALAIASGCKPEQGLWTAIIGGFLISLLGGSRVLIGGPAGAFVGLCANVRSRRLHCVSWPRLCDAGGGERCGVHPRR